MLSQIERQIDYTICKTQGSIYEQQAKDGYDIVIFSDLYLKSDFCRRAFDTIYSRFQIADRLECLDFILPEIGGKCRKFTTREEIFSPDVAYWIGFTYRQLYIETCISSRELSERLSFEAMCRYYPGLHTVDEYMATGIICNDYGFEKKAEYKELEE